MSRVWLQAELATRPVFDAIFRPSREGPTHLTLTIKFTDTTFMHKGTATRC